MHSIPTINCVINLVMCIRQSCAISFLSHFCFMLYVTTNTFFIKCDTNLAAFLRKI
jgi:hypothetical protein